MYRLALNTTTIVKKKKNYEQLKIETDNTLKKKYF